MLIPACK